MAKRRDEPAGRHEDQEGGPPDGVGSESWPKRGWSKRCIRHLAVFALVGACAWLCHPVLLRGVGRLLVADGREVRGDCVWIRTDDGFHVDGDRCYERAAQLYRQDTSRRIILMEPYPCRLVRTGIVPGFEEISRRALAARRVPDVAVTVIAGRPRTLWEEAHLLEGWLRGQDDARVVLLCTRFSSRRWRYVVDTVLGAERAARVQVVALRDRRYDETNWWRSRVGVKEIFDWGLRLAYAWCQGERAGQNEPPWNPDDYERRLRRSMRKGE